MEEPKKKRHGCLWAVVIVLLVVGVIAGLAAFGARSSRSLARRGLGMDEYPDLNETWSCGSGDVKVVRIPLTGVIVLGEDEGLFSSVAGSANETLRAIRRATHDPDVRAIILEVDSGGGGITASDIIYKALMDFRKARPDRKIVAIMGDVAASGAYYVAVAADDIVGHPTTLTGSIGVIIETLNVRELGQKIGIKDVTIKSGANKDLLNPFGELSDEQRSMLQGLVDELHDRFVQLVAARRSLPPEEVRKLADGRVFLASKALNLGLIDQIGYWDDAVDKTAQLLGSGKVKVFRYEQRFSLSSFLKGVQKWNPVSDLLWKPARARLLYLWEP